MQGTPTAVPALSGDTSRSALDFVHGLLGGAAADSPDLSVLLADLARAFTAPVAGLASLPTGAPIAVHPDEAVCPWHHDPEVLNRVGRMHTSLTVPEPAGGSTLLTVLGTADSGAWLLWLSDDCRSQWTEGEAAALFLAGQAINCRLGAGESRPRWAEQLDHVARQQRLEAAARLVRRLAHDFGNLLTGILGFSELALAQQVPAGTPLHTYLTEVYRSAQNGAVYTDRLRLFARRQASSSRSCTLALVVGEEEGRLRPTLRDGVTVSVETPPDLPPLAVDADALRHVLAALLDNAREALNGPGAIRVSARSVQLKEAECRDLFGDVRPGENVEITIADTGTGLSAETRRQLFQEPYFSTKPRHRGFGLAIAYGLLAAHRGGLELLPQPEGGCLARVVVPAAAPVVRAPSSALDSQSDKILIVDDDPMVLQFVATTLQGAGYRVQAVGSGADALRACGTTAADPFRLVLSDVLMPNLNGVELARLLLERDPNVRVLFMSGQVTADCVQRAFAPGQVEMLPKPFRPDGLLRAVRAALRKR